MTQYYDDFMPEIGATTDFAIKYAQMLQALDVDVTGGGGGGGASGGQTCIYAGRQASGIALADSVTFGVHTGRIPDTTIITSSQVNATDITLSAGKTYTGQCEATIDCANDDMTRAFLSIRDTSDGNVAHGLAIDQKLINGSMEQVKLSCSFLVSPASDIAINVSFGTQGTGCSIGSQQSPMGLSNFIFTIFEQV